MTDALPDDRKFVGLVNKKSTCYLNVVVQLIYFIPGLRDMICNAKTTGKTDQDPKTMLLLQTLTSVLSRLQKREIAFHPTELIKVINTLEETSESQEEDAFYAFETIFQALDAYSDVGALGRDFMNMFGSECSDSENRKQTTYCFELKLDEVDSADSSTQATTIEQLIANQYTTFRKLAPILMVKLVRVPDEDVSKNNAKVEFPSVLSLKESGQAGDIDVEYRIHSIICHSEGEQSTAQTEDPEDRSKGHYTIHVDTGLDQAEWYLFDDKEVSKSSPDQAIRDNYGDGSSGPNAYIITYIREDMRNEIVFKLEGYSEADTEKTSNVGGRKRQHNKSSDSDSTGPTGGVHPSFPTD